MTAPAGGRPVSAAGPGGRPVSAAEALEVVTEAVAVVLDLDPTGLRGDSPLADLGADSLARICLADAIESAAADRFGVRVRLPERTLVSAVTLAELAAPLVGATATVEEASA